MTMQVAQECKNVTWTISLLLYWELSQCFKHLFKMSIKMGGLLVMCKQTVKARHNKKPLLTDTHILFCPCTRKCILAERSQFSALYLFDEAFNEHTGDKLHYNRLQGECTLVLSIFE